MPTLLRARTPSLNIAYEQTGPEDAPAVLLLHGFPYDIRQYDDLRAQLTHLHLRIIVPFLRGFGPTTYVSSGTMRSGQQAALGKDVVDLLDTLRIPQAVLVGYDWGGRAACVAAALWPDRVRGLVTSGYTIEDIATSAVTPRRPEQEYRLWYQWYFQTDRGRLGLEKKRTELCHFLWKLWSPTWNFSEQTFSETAQSFNNPDFVATAIHSYRHRYGNAPGDPSLQTYEDQLERRPSIHVPSITVHGAVDQVEPPSGTDDDHTHFSAEYDRRIFPDVGHCIAAEAPTALSQAIQDILKTSRNTSV